ncbi:hypothetical protein IFM12275_24970 [Nocardia sputorum]|uniref:serine/threonine-protein kinase n=1 Tax=Nocardia sputorum TaxID=2984338 RepID=UPI002492C376|nr:serine/threonine-protein kinase [Nocardia sputorum]BDT92521.1 hypothetical protein IFM12275_24970 [Nocardia sputorum]
MDVVDGAVFAGYRIERRLGAGGMGTVFLVQHPRLPRRDALKILADSHLDDPEFRARFLREAEIAAWLQHPNLVAVRDRGEQDGRLWITMQYVDGVDVAELIRRGQAGLDPARAVRIVTEAARGLDEIHRAGLLHRDVKPANILVAPQPDGSDRVLVTDFGIARPADDSPTLAVGGMTASLAYAAPEQISGDRADRRGDVYSLGCTLYQMLTGSVPFPRDSPGSVMYAHLNEPPPRPSLGKPGLPAAFDAVVAKAMAKNPGDRFGSCGELARAAEAALTGEIPGVAAASTGHPRGRRLLAIVAAAAVVVSVAISVWALARPDESAARRVPRSTSPVPAVSSAWGAYAYMAEAFPQLLPFSPDGVGYQEAAFCRAVDENGRQIAFATEVPVGALRCNGDRDPAVLLEVFCNADRSAMVQIPRDRTEGVEQWSRASGAGSLHWSNYTTVLGEVSGRLDVYFDAPNRKFCRLQVVGGDSGAEMRARWWADAPL